MLCFVVRVVDLESTFEHSLIVTVTIIVSIDPNVNIVSCDLQECQPVMEAMCALAVEETVSDLYVYTVLMVQKTLLNSISSHVYLYLLNLIRMWHLRKVE